MMAWYSRDRSSLSSSMSCWRVTVVDSRSLIWSSVSPAEFCVERIAALPPSVYAKKPLTTPMETRRGISASLVLACGTGAFDLVDLDCHFLLPEEGENPYFDQEGPTLRTQA